MRTLIWLSFITTFLVITISLPGGYRSEYDFVLLG